MGRPTDQGFQRSNIGLQVGAFYGTHLRRIDLNANRLSDDRRDSLHNFLHRHRDSGADVHSRNPRRRLFKDFDHGSCRIDDGNEIALGRDVSESDDAVSVRRI